MTLSYIKPIDGLRGIALLLVVVWHYINCQIDLHLTAMVKILKAITYWGWTGVDLFFVLSGYLIGRILIHSRLSNNYFRTFYIRRSLRIFPPYYLSLIVFSIILAYWPDEIPWLTHEHHPLFSYYLYIQNFWVAYVDFGAHWLGMTWSLALEEQFYLLFPALVFFIPPKLLPKLLVLGVFLAPIFRYFYSTSRGGYVLLPARMDALFIGALIAYFHLNGQLDKLFSAKQRWLKLSLVLQIFILFVFKLITKQGLGGVLLHSLLALIYATLLIYVLMLNNQQRAYRLLSHTTLVFFGKISYVFYLTHQIFSGLLHQFMLHQSPRLHDYIDLMVTTCAFILTFIFSTLSYFYFEKPILLWAKKYNY